MDGSARRGALVKIAQQHAAVPGDEDIVQDQGPAAGAAQAQYVPVVLDLGRVQGDEQITGAARAFGAQYGPLSVAAAGGEGEAPAQPPSPRRVARRFSGRQRRRGDGARVGAPDIVLRLLWHAGEDPLVLAQYRVNPGGGGAAFREDFDDVRKDAEAGLVPAEAAGLQHKQEAGAMEVRDGFVGDGAGGFHCRRAGGQRGHKFSRFVDRVHRIVCHAADRSAPAHLCQGRPQGWLNDHRIDRPC